jgi:hypothetical protein
MRRPFLQAAEILLMRVAPVCEKHRPRNYRL